MCRSKQSQTATYRLRTIPEAFNPISEPTSTPDTPNPGPQSLNSTHVNTTAWNHDSSPSDYGPFHQKPLAPKLVEESLWHLGFYCNPKPWLLRTFILTSLRILKKKSAVCHLRSETTLKSRDPPIRCEPQMRILLQECIWELMLVGGFNYQNLPFCMFLLYSRL